MTKTCPVCSTTYPDSDSFCPKDGSTLRIDEAAETLIGSVIADRYLVSKLLGEGGMGQVYLAGHVRLPQQAAIKVLNASMVQDPAAVARFNREAANAARIEHERVARVFDFGETSSGLVYLAMEFVPGRTLRALLDESGRMPPARAANIVYQVAEGLDAAHRISIVHRDLKPDNILVITDDKGVDRCKVVDFGIAKAFDDGDSRRTQLTQAGAIIGTPEFMSPEQVLGEQLDARSDVYALAVVAYNLLTGALPFAASTPERSLTARLISDPLPLRESAPGIEWPAELQDAFDRALSREPSARTSTALEFAEEVVAATEGWTGAIVLRGRTPMSAPVQSPTAQSHGAHSAVHSPNTQQPTAQSTSVQSHSAQWHSEPSRASNSVDAPPSQVRAEAIPARSRKLLATLSGIGALLAVAVIAFFALNRDDISLSANNAAVSDTISDSISAAAAAETANQESTAARPQDAGVTDDASATGTSAPGGAPRLQDNISTGAASRTPDNNAVGTAGNAADNNSSTEAQQTSGLSSRDEAQRALNTIVRQLSSADDEVLAARAAIPALSQLLASFDSASDSAWVYIYLSQSHMVAGDAPRACTSLKSAARLGRSENQTIMVAALRGNEFFKDCPL